MKRKTTIALALAVSLVANLLLGIALYVQHVEQRLAEEGAQERAEERDLLMTLIPELHPQVNNAELQTILRRKYPGEEVNATGDVVQWRLFHFRFGEDGRLEEIAWYS